MNKLDLKEDPCHLYLFKALVCIAFFNKKTWISFGPEINMELLLLLSMLRLNTLIVYSNDNISIKCDIFSPLLMSFTMLSLCLRELKFQILS